MFSNTPDSSINDIFIESPNTANPRNQYLSLRSIFTDGAFVEFQVAGQFFSCHDVGHMQIPQGKRCSNDCFRTVTDEDSSYIHFKIIKIKPKYMRKPKSFTLSIPIRGRATQKGFPFVQRKVEIRSAKSLKGILAKSSISIC
jgi:hypothetical protein